VYKFLKAHEGKEGLHYKLREMKDMRRWELDEILDDVTSKDFMQKEIYLIDNLANLNGHTIVRLPPYNCELNPIELVWKGVKHNIRKKLGNQNLDEIKTSAEYELRNFDKTTLKNNF
jgi:hypothetical protein